MTDRIYDLIAERHKDLKQDGFPELDPTNEDSD